jgi:hypothetical protein
MYLVRHASLEFGGGEVHAEHGYYSRIWKDELQRQLDAMPHALCEKLRSDGIDLEDLPGALRHWARAPTTVIHAPQRRDHFEILIRVLGVEQAMPGQDGKHRPLPWWQRAWREIAASRGVAIQAGVLGHEAFEEEVLKVLKRMLPEVRRSIASEGGSFSLSFPDDAGFNGMAFFDRVLSIDRGFAAPDGDLRLVQELGALEKWRA